MRIESGFVTRDTTYDLLAALINELFAEMGASPEQQIHRAIREYSNAYTMALESNAPLYDRVYYASCTLAYILLGYVTPDSSEQQVCVGDYYLIRMWRIIQNDLNLSHAEMCNAIILTMTLPDGRNWQRLRNLHNLTAAESVLSNLLQSAVHFTKEG